MTSHASPLRITVIGAGVVGCYLGGRLARHADVTLVGRPHVLDPIRSAGLTVESGADDRVHVAASGLVLAESPESVRRADVVLVCTKAGATASATAEFVPFLGRDAVIVGMQNGLHSSDTIRDGVDANTVVTGMVPFNVARTGPTTYRRTSAGDVMLAEHPRTGPLLPVMEQSGIRVRSTDDIQAVLHGKLLMNLNNAIQALSGLPLRAQLLDRDLRRCVAMCQVEAFRVFTRVGVVPRVPISAPARVLPAVMSLPTPVFRTISGAVLQVDPDGTSSMHYDLEQGRPTEVDILQGEIVGMARRVDLSAPACERVVELVRDAERAGKSRRKWSGPALVAQLKQARRLDRMETRNAA